MTPIVLHIPGPSSQALPLALMFPSRRLLTEKSLVTIQFKSTEGNIETLEIRATKVTTTLNKILGYAHYGINE